jgi:L-asparaginase / beta-aspartyl-peptidase
VPDQARTAAAPDDPGAEAAEAIAIVHSFGDCDTVRAMRRGERRGGARVPSIVVHGGAGADPAEGRDELRAGVRDAAAAGWRVLVGSGHALDAVEAAVRLLEDHPRFNAGRGSVLTAEGTVEMDASIMEGERLRCGAAGAVSRVANPVSLARRVLDDGRHVLLVGEGAHAFARASGLPACDPATLVTERQRLRHGRAPAGAETVGGTVGAVALDRQGRVAAATSTGGIAGKRPGRVGDSALIGCGTYADWTIGGASCTGDGEAIIRVVLARRALDYLKEADDSDYAARVAVDLLVEEGGGQGGVILLDWRGRVGWAHSTPLMPVAWMAPALEAPCVPF